MHAAAPAWKKGTAVGRRAQISHTQEPRVPAEAMATLAGSRGKRLASGWTRYYICHIREQPHFGSRGLLMYLPFLSAKFTSQRDSGPRLAERSDALPRSMLARRIKGSECFPAWAATKRRTQLFFGLAISRLSDGGL